MNEPTSIKQKRKFYFPFSAVAVLFTTVLLAIIASIRVFYPTLMHFPFNLKDPLYFIYELSISGYFESFAIVIPMLVLTVSLFPKKKGIWLLPPMIWAFSVQTYSLLETINMRVVYLGYSWISSVPEELFNIAQKFSTILNIGAIVILFAALFLACRSKKLSALKIVLFVATTLLIVLYFLGGIVFLLAKMPSIFKFFEFVIGTTQYTSVSGMPTLVVHPVLSALITVLEAISVMVFAVALEILAIEVVLPFVKKKKAQAPVVAEEIAETAEITEEADATED